MCKHVLLSGIQAMALNHSILPGSPAHVVPVAQIGCSVTPAAWEAATCQLCRPAFVWILVVRQLGIVGHGWATSGTGHTAGAKVASEKTDHSVSPRGLEGLLS